MAKAVEMGIPKLKIEESAAKRQALIDQGIEVIVGVNKFKPTKEEEIPILEVDNTAVRENQIARLKEIKSKRNQKDVDEILQKITDASGSGQWARFEVIMPSIDYDFATNRYYIITKELQELHKSIGFTWNNVSTIKIYATVLKNGSPSSDFYVGLDAVRFENISTTNPIYGLTGYTVLKNTNAETIVKAANTSNYIEFRFAMDVQ